MKKFTVCMLFVLLFVPIFLCACDNKADIYAFFNDDSATYYVGDKVDLKDVGYKSNASLSKLRFSIENEGIARLQNDEIVFLKSGHTKLVLSVFGCDCNAEIDLMVKPKITVPDLNPEKTKNDKDDNSTESRVDKDDTKSDENLDNNDKNDYIKVISNDKDANQDNQNKSNSEDKPNGDDKTDLDENQNGIKRFDFDEYTVEIKNEESSFMVKNLTAQCATNFTSFSLLLSDENDDYSDFSYEVRLPNGYSSNLIHIDRTSDTLSILCLSKCDFCLIITSPNALGYMTIAFRIK